MTRRGGGGADRVRQRVNECMNRLSDRDTESMAASELDAMARSLVPESLPPFISAISDARPTDKTPLRRHSIRLLSLLSSSLPLQTTAPHLPRMLSAALRRLRDPDSSVRAACADAARSIASAHPSSFTSTFLPPLIQALLQEQDSPAQAAAALTLAAAIDAASVKDCSCCPDLPHQLQRLLGRLLKLLRSPAFKAKPALLTLLGSVAEAGGAGNAPLLGALVPCLVEFLASEDWSARKAAAEALSKVAVAERDMLGDLKTSCISSFESRKFDKVKIVRESMTRMLEVWNDIPVAVEEETKTQLHPSSPFNSSSICRERSISDCRFSNSSRGSSTICYESPPTMRRRSRLLVSRSPPPVASPIHSVRKGVPPPSRKMDKKRNSAWKIEIAVPHAAAFKGSCEEITNDLEGTEDDTKSNMERKHTLYDKGIEDKSGKLGGLKSNSRIAPVQEKGRLDSESKGTTNEFYASEKDGERDLSLVRMQLVQIENQQASLLDLLQRFIGNSQNSISSLEARVHGLERALNEISLGLAISSGRVPNDQDITCCSLPGTEFLSPKFWRKTEGRYASQLSLSGDPISAAMRTLNEKGGSDGNKWDKRRFGAHGRFVANPLAEFTPQSIVSEEITASKILKGSDPNTEVRLTDIKVEDESSQK